MIRNASAAPPHFRSVCFPDGIDSDTAIKTERKCIIWSEPLDDGAEAIVKLYRRRRVTSFVRATIFSFRAQREFRILRRLDAAGIPCSVPVSWSRGYSRRHGFYEMLCTRRIGEVEPLPDVLASRGRAGEGLDLEPLFCVVRDMHECGVYHGALSAKNILVGGGGEQKQFYIIDLAHGCLFRRSIVGERIADQDLQKLVRSIEHRAGADYCKAYLVASGFGKEELERLYREVDRYRNHTRKQKRTKNLLKIKVFLLALWTRWKHGTHGKRNSRDDGRNDQ